MAESFDKKIHVGRSDAVSDFGEMGYLDGVGVELQTVKAGDTMTLIERGAAGGTGCRPLNSPPLNSPEHETLIGSSRQRSHAFGLQERDAPDFSAASHSLVNQALETIGLKVTIQKVLN